MSPQLIVHNSQNTLRKLKNFENWQVYLNFHQLIKMFNFETTNSPYHFIILYQVPGFNTQVFFVCLFSYILIKSLKLSSFWTLSDLLLYFYSHTNLPSQSSNTVGVDPSYFHYFLWVTAKLLLFTLSLLHFFLWFLSSYTTIRILLTAAVKKVKCVVFLNLWHAFYFEPLH